MSATADDGQAAGRSVAQALRHVSRNTLYMLAGQIVSKVASFAYILILARWITVQEFGYFNLVLSFILIADVVVDCGLTRLIIRDVARDEDKASRYLGNVLPLKTLLSAIGYGGLIAFVWIADYPVEIALLTAVAGLSLLPASFSMAFDAVLHGRQHMVYSAAAGVVLTLTQVAAGTGVLLLNARLSWVMAALVFAYLVYMLFLGYGTWVRGYRFRLRIDPAFSLRLLKSALPYAGIAILGSLSARAEILILGWFESTEALGLYSAAIKFPEAALFFPLMFGSAITPLMSEFHMGAREKLRTVYFWASRLLTLVVLPAAMCAVLLAGPIIALLFPPEYSGAAPLFQIMFLAFPFAALQVLNASVLLSSDRQQRTILVYLVATLAQIALNLALIPWLGATGAALGFLGTQVLLFTLSSWCIRHWFLHSPGMLANLAQPVVAGLVMLSIAFWLYGHLQYWALAPALAAYAGTLAAAGKLVSAAKRRPAVDRDGGR